MTQEYNGRATTTRRLTSTGSRHSQERILRIQIRTARRMPWPISILWNVKKPDSWQDFCPCVWVCMCAYEIGAVIWAGSVVSAHKDGLFQHYCFFVHRNATMFLWKDGWKGGKFRWMTNTVRGLKEIYYLWDQKVLSVVRLGCFIFFSKSPKLCNGVPSGDGFRPTRQKTVQQLYYSHFHRIKNNRYR